MTGFFERATQLQEEIVSNRRYLHQHAETGMELPNTVDFVCKRLREYGCEPELMGGGVVCRVGKPGKTILLRADMDALVQKEASGVPYACASGKACHSCGHDTHTAMLLAAAKMLKEREDELCGTVKLMFQPGEEVILGAKSMIDAGLLENPKPDAAVAIHISFGNTPYIDADTGAEISRSPRIMTYVPGPATQSSDAFRVTVRGTSCHGSEPYKGVSAISAACNMVTALQQLVTMEVNCKDAAVVSICTINGGAANNIICDEVVFSGSIRAFDNSVQKKLKRRFEETCRGIAAAFGASVEVDYTVTVPAAYNEPAFSKEIIGYAADICDAVYPIVSTPGSEDFAWLSAYVDKAILMNLCAGSDKEGYPYPGHDPRMTLDEDTFRYGAACYAHCASQWLKNNR